MFCFCEEYKSSFLIGESGVCEEYQSNIFDWGVWRYYICVWFLPVIGMRRKRGGMKSYWKVKRNHNYTWSKLFKLRKAIVPIYSPSLPIFTVEYYYFHRNTPSRTKAITRTPQFPRGYIQLQCDALAHHVCYSITQDYDIVISSPQSMRGSQLYTNSQATRTTKWQLRRSATVCSMARLAATAATTETDPKADPEAEEVIEVKCMLVS